MDILQYAAFKKMFGSPGGGGGEAEPVIIDVYDELPTEGIQEGAVYRLTTAHFAFYGGFVPRGTIYQVAELPESGEPCTDADLLTMVGYYNVVTETLHAYVDNMISAGLGIPVGWYGAELVEAFGYNYGGIAHTLEETIGDTAIRLVFEIEYYEYNDGWRLSTIDFQNEDPITVFLKFRGGCQYMFARCDSLLTRVPLFDTRNITDMNRMFEGCSVLVSVPSFDTRNVTNMDHMFWGCSSLASVPEFDTRNVTNMYYMFCGCSVLASIPAFDMRNATNTGSMFDECMRLTDIRIRNIKSNLWVGSGKEWGHLLTVDSLIHLIYELRDTGSSKTLTVGSENLEKIANVYVKTIDITDEMRAEDDLIDEKLPFVVCESTDEGACLIEDYMAFKNWRLA